MRRYRILANAGLIFGKGKSSIVEFHVSRKLSDMGAATSHVSLSMRRVLCLGRLGCVHGSRLSNSSKGRFGCDIDSVVVEYNFEIRCT